MEKKHLTKLMIKLDKDVFLRSFKVLADQSFDLFLGAGASMSSGISSGGDLVWHFKRELLISSGKIPSRSFLDLKIESSKTKIQSFFIEEDLKVDNQYSHYFKKCYPDLLVRQDFLSDLVRDKKPSIGFSCLSALINHNKIATVWTTNFDDLVEKAINKMDLSCKVVSPENSASIGNFRNDIPTVVKLHGDFRYDLLQNTSEELQKIEENLHNYFLQTAEQKSLLVIGYSGSDESVLSTLEKAVEKTNVFPRGLIWCVPKGVTPNKRLIEIINKANKQNKRSGFMEIDSFDYFMYELYKTCGLRNLQIDSITKERFDQRRPFRLPQHQSNTTPVFINAINAVLFPKTVFRSKTNILGEGKWKKLRGLLEDSNIVASFSKGNELSFFGDETEINQVFKEHLIEGLELVDIPDNLYNNPDSFYIGLLYDLIEKSIENDYGLKIFKRGKKIRRVYSIEHALSKEEIERIPKWLNFHIPKGYQVFEAFEFKVQLVNKRLFLMICPTVHIEYSRGLDLDENIVNKLTNTISSNRWNNWYGKKVVFWFNLLKQRNASLSFGLGDFEIKLSKYFSTAPVKTLEDVYYFDSYYKIDEPMLYFHHYDEAKKSIHPLKGLKYYGSLDESFDSNGMGQSIQLAIITPDTGFELIKTHLESLLNSECINTEKEYLIDYPGFDAVFKKRLVIPNSTNSENVITINSRDISNYKVMQFYDLMKSLIDKLALRSSGIDCVVIYIPKKWERFKEVKNENVYFDLHDSLKLYAIKKGLRLQFVEDRSIEYRDKAKVKWWLSLAIYVKSNGTPWKVKTDNTETAFVGLGYALKSIGKKKVVLGSSQIFDGNGNGSRILLQPIEKPVFYNENPFMSKEDAFRLVTNIRNTYYKIDPIIGLKKLVLHKTTHFTRDEIEGICNALEGVDNIELLQIQEFNYWRALKLKRKEDVGHEFDGFPIERGTIIQLDDFSFLLWTHGVVENNEINNKYYQGKRGVPTPLLIKRFRGTDPIEMVANDILKLTKMNWNGAELYKKMPVTIEFSKKLSTMGKQLVDLGNYSYDFRYFI